MALSERAAAIAPYAEQLIYNSDVQASARDAAQAARAAYRRARGRDAQEVIQDKKFRRQVDKAASAISGLWGEVQEPQPKRRWGRWVLVLLLLSGLVAVIANQSSRDRLQGLVSRGGETSQTTSEASPSASEVQPISSEQNGDPIG